jgi:hypothetical protein
MDVAAGHQQAQRPAAAVDEGVHLAGAPAARAAYGLVGCPLFAPAAAR